MRRTIPRKKATKKRAPRLPRHWRKPLTAEQKQKLVALNEFWSLIGEGLHIVLDVWDGDEPEHAIEKAKRRLERGRGIFAKPKDNESMTEAFNRMIAKHKTGGSDAADKR